MARKGPRGHEPDGEEVEFTRNYLNLGKQVREWYEASEFNAWYRHLNEAAQLAVTLIERLESHELPLPPIEPRGEPVELQQQDGVAFKVELFTPTREAEEEREHVLGVLRGSIALRDDVRGKLFSLLTWAGISDREPGPGRPRNTVEDMLIEMLAREPVAPAPGASLKQVNLVTGEITPLAPSESLRKKPRSAEDIQRVLDKATGQDRDKGTVARRRRRRRPK